MHNEVETEAINQSFSYGHQDKYKAAGCMYTMVIEGTQLQIDRGVSEAKLP